ncbi:sialate O-acetylesterase [Tichowtungia aerotolerans]|uniref:Sialate O-acetylesterase domain-containing protein n=1 Tax=Tichowtungia aerotolerans TaxID=2697043 RepID=A0A6P1MDY4_9BACT|nr:sialate O-acetylesterase [Tichowtungia aerotolerans]QHI69806.1 hypothetical protein GT409_10210 [Tichowtungia aerotolerans]
MKISIAGQTLDAVADADGRWETVLSPVGRGGPYVMTVTDDEATLMVSDVLFGEVWLASGQSNVGINVGKSDGVEAGLKLADQLLIRFFTMPINLNLQPQDDLAGGQWIVCASENSASLSAVGYYFACRLSRIMNSPVAVIQSAWGGFRIQNWMPVDALKSNPDLRQYASEFEERCIGLSAEQRTPVGLMELGDIYLKYNNAWVQYRKTKKGSEPVPPTTPRTPHAVALNYNAMIHPLVPYAIKGALWYQGEADSNPTDAPLYAELLSSMIDGWRKDRSSDFPFIVIQLPEYAAVNREGPWICVRDQQRRTLDQTDNTVMVVTIGYGNMNDIHPLNKRSVGELAANAALSKAYQHNTPWCGPLIQSADQKGDELVLKFETFGRQVRSSSPELAGFEVSEDGNAFHPVSAKIKKNQVVIPINESVQCVRYGWDVNPKLTLHDDAGLLASLFLKEVR